MEAGSISLWFLLWLSPGFIAFAKTRYPVVQLWLYFTYDISVRDKILAASSHDIAVSCRLRKVMKTLDTTGYLKNARIQRFAVDFQKYHKWVWNKYGGTAVVHTVLNNFYIAPISNWVHLILVHIVICWYAVERCGACNAFLQSSSKSTITLTSTNKLMLS